MYVRLKMAVIDAILPAVNALPSCAILSMSKRLVRMVLFLYAYKIPV